MNFIQHNNTLNARTIGSQYGHQSPYTVYLIFISTTTQNILYQGYELIHNYTVSLWNNSNSLRGHKQQPKLYKQLWAEQLCTYTILIRSTSPGVLALILPDCMNSVTVQHEQLQTALNFSPPKSRASMADISVTCYKLLVQHTVLDSLGTSFTYIRIGNGRYVSEVDRSPPRVWILVSL